jgi:hypothetical protein
VCLRFTLGCVRVQITVRQNNDHKSEWAPVHMAFCGRVDVSFVLEADRAYTTPETLFAGVQDPVTGARSRLALSSHVSVLPSLVFGGSSHRSLGDMISLEADDRCRSSLVENSL